MILLEDARFALSLSDIQAHFVYTVAFGIVVSRLALKSNS